MTTDFAALVADLRVIAVVVSEGSDGFTGRRDPDSPPQPAKCVCGNLLTIADAGIVCRECRWSMR